MFQLETFSTMHQIKLHAHLHVKSHDVFLRPNSVHVKKYFSLSLVHQPVCGIYHFTYLS